VRTSSAKAKGRRACAEARDALLRVLGLEPDDIHVTSSGATGKDLKLSPRARSRFPFVLEVKNQEALNIWEAYAQAEDHWAKEVSREEVYPAVIYRRNRSDLMISMSLEDLLHFLFERGKNAQPVQASQSEESPYSEGTHLP
jgi:hypothetical protein